MKQVLALLLISVLLSAQTITIVGSVSISGQTSPSFSIDTQVTSTQALIKYTPPSGSACTLKVSETSNYTPVVNDVNSSLFSGSNSDARSTTVTSGTTRIFVAGSRLTAVAADGKKYSRALQANTLHYFEINCSGIISTGTFTTANIPVGSTFNEPYLADPNSAGDSLIPTITGTRGQVIIDSQTGAWLSPVNIATDRPPLLSSSTGYTLGSGARVITSNRVTNTDGSGNVGYILNLDAQIGYRGAFFHVPATGESRPLGRIVFSPSSGSIIDSNLQSYQYATPLTTLFNYTGAYASRDESVGQFAQFDAGTSFLTNSIETLMHNFDSTFDVSSYGCDSVTPINEYTPFKCLRGNQDSYGWIGVFRKSTKTVVAAWNTFIQQPTKFCGVHEYLDLNGTVNGTNVVALNWHSLPLDNFGLGTAAIQTTLALGIPGGATSLTTSGNPVSQFTSGDSVTPPVPTVGDVFTLPGAGNNPNRFTLITKIGNNWTFIPPVQNAVASGTKLAMDCNAPHSIVDDVWSITYWPYLLDTHGTDTTGTTVIPDTHFPGGGHDSFGPLGRVAETANGWAHYPFTTGSFLTSLNLTGVSIISQSYNGVTPPGFGVLLTRHPSYHQATNDPYFFDFVGFNGGDPQCFSGSGGRYYSACIGAVPVSGSLYQYFSDSSYPLHRKLIATQTSNGFKSLRDISGPSSLLLDTVADNYKYCVTRVGGECRPGSVPGNIYFNVPVLDVTGCVAHNGPYPVIKDICINDTPLFSGAVVQLYMGLNSDDSLSKSRVLTNALLNAPKDIVGYPLAKSTPDGSYVLFTRGAGINGSTSPIDTWKAKVPILPAPDGIDRTKYIDIDIPVTAGPQDNVVVKFWYTEYNGYCGTRAEDCYATKAIIPSGNDPYLYPTDGTAHTLVTLTGLPCFTGCTVRIPAISGRMVYYQIVRRDIFNFIIDTLPTNVVRVQ